MSAAVRGACECAWCGRTLREGAPELPVSHGICAGCAAATELFPVEDLMTLDAAALDALPWGMVRLDADGVVTEYNAAEQALSGRDRARTVGRHFFREVAPCTNVRSFAGRFDEMVRAGRPARERLEFVFRFAGGDLLVDISMCVEGNGAATLLVRSMP